MRFNKKWKEALKYFETHDGRHLSTEEQIKRALICYWTVQPLPAGMKAMCMVMDDYNKQNAQRVVTARKNSRNRRKDIMAGQPG